MHALLLAVSGECSAKGSAAERLYTIDPFIRPPRGESGSNPAAKFETRPLDFFLQKPECETGHFGQNVLALSLPVRACLECDGSVIL